MSKLLGDLVPVTGVRMCVNHGTNRVRFITPVPVGSRVRARAKLLSAETMKDGATQCAYEVTIEIEGKEKPACVVECLSRIYP